MMAFAFPRKTPIAAVARTVTDMQIFAVANDGEIWSTAWAEGNKWSDWFRVGTGLSPEEAPVSLCSRNREQFDVFAVGIDGRVNQMWWNKESWRDAPPIGTRTFPLNTPIAALSRNSDQMDLFAVGTDGRVYNAWWNGNPWREWGAPIGSREFPVNTPIAALSRNSDQMDLFAVGTDGRVYNAWWNGNPWREWGAPIGSREFPVNTPIAALSRNSDQMDLFAVGTDGRVYNAWWNGNPWREWGAPIGSREFPVNTPIAALSRNSDQMDLFAVGTDGRVYNAWWNGNPWREWGAPIGSREFPANTPIAALSRNRDHMELYAVGDDGQVYCAWWDGTWHNWVRPKDSAWYPVELQTPAIDGTPAAAYASHKARAQDIAARYAHDKSMAEGVIQPDTDKGKKRVTEDVIFQWIAHLHVLALKKRTSTNRAAEDPAELLQFRARLRQRVSGKVGTGNDYDMALKGLMVILYRYRDLLSDDDRAFILNVLVPASVKGRHDGDVEVYKIADTPEEFEEVAAAAFATIVSLFTGGAAYGALAAAGFWMARDGIYVPETENHKLMIQTAKYLVNQFLFTEFAPTKGDTEYCNETNGVEAWLLKHLQSIAQHDLVEFNSRSYSRHTLHTLLNLYEFADSNKIKAAAQILLDYQMVKFAVTSNRGRRISPFRRLPHNINHPATVRNELWRNGSGNDPLIGMFAAYVGPMDRDDHPEATFPEGWSAVAVLFALSTYRPPPAAYALAMTECPPMQHRFFHGHRPELRGSDDQIEGGVEIYYRSRSFLLSAGGIFLGSGYGFDELDLPVKKAWKDVARAQSITLLPTKGMNIPGAPQRDLKFMDLIRFDPWPDDWTTPSEDNVKRPHAVATGVSRGFACGANLRVPLKWLQLGAAIWDQNWLFLDLNRDLPLYGPLGFYVAIYQTPPPNNADDPAPENLGILYAMEAASKGADGAVIDFAAFMRLTRERNGNLPEHFRLAASGDFHSPDDKHFRFWLMPTGDKYRARVTDVHDHQPENSALETWPLVDGLHLKAIKTPNGHEGVFDITHPGCDAPLRLDFSDHTNPAYPDELEACPQAWADRAAALVAFAYKLAGNARLWEAVDAAADGVRLYERLVAVDPVKHRPALAGALFELIHYFRDGLEAGPASAFALQGLNEYEVLAGVRPAGSAEAVDYETLAGFTPNEYWEGLASALSNLSWRIAWKADDQPGAAGWAVKRVRLYERLVAVDPVKHRPALAGALFELIHYFRDGLEAGPASAFALQGLNEYEVLAGVRPAGSAEAVDYETLAGFTPNEYWEGLASALSNLSWRIAWKADDQPGAAGWAVKRVRLYERLVAVDPVKHRPALAGALFELIHYFRDGLEAGPASAFALQGLNEYEVLAGVRPAGSAEAVDYETLAGFTPNEYWEGLASALSNLSWRIAWKADDQPGAAGWAVKRVRLYERLVAVDPVKHRPALAGALFELIHYFRDGLEAGPASAFALQGLNEYEVLAGVRPAGSAEAVDYETLAGFTPNEYWEGLASALSNLSWRIAWKADDQPGAAGWAVKRVRLYERLVAVDPVKHRPALAGALFELIHYFRDGLEAGPASAFALQGLNEYEVLAGVRPAGSAEAVDYETLAGFTPNEYWEGLASALSNLSWRIAWKADDQPGAAGWAVKRVRLYERLVAVDPVKHRPALEQAQAEFTTLGG